MKSASFATLGIPLVSLLVAIGSASACTVTVEPSQSAVSDAAVDAPVVNTDAASDASTTPETCPAPPAIPACEKTTPAPKAKADIASFIQASAVPIRCSAAANDKLWDLRHLVTLYGAQKMFMVGEVHGSNEIGIVSSRLLEELGSKKLVNVLGYEFPMDAEESFQNYIDTGSDPFVDEYIGQMPPNMFAAILTETAKGLKKRGLPIRLAAVDIPYQPDYPVSELAKIGNKLTTQKNLVLGTLPSPNNPPTVTDFQQVNTYFDSVMAKKTEVCAELSAADCDRFFAYLHALWAATMAYDENEAQSELWFARREEVIYYNMHDKMRDPADRMFLHMGAFHTNKHAMSAGSRMAHEYALTKGQVFSVGPAYGDGSVIHYGQDQKIPGEPRTVMNALTHTPPHPLFVPLNQPSDTCVQNPLGLEADEGVAGEALRGELYDGYLHYGKLTSEAHPKDATLSSKSGGPNAASVSPRVLALQSFRERVERREERALEASKRARRLRAP